MAFMIYLGDVKQSVGTKYLTHRPIRNIRNIRKAPISVTHKKRTNICRLRGNPIAVRALNYSQHSKQGTRTDRMTKIAPAQGPLANSGCQSNFSRSYQHPIHRRTCKRHPNDAWVFCLIWLSSAAYSGQITQMFADPPEHCKVQRGKDSSVGPTYDCSTIGTQGRVDYSGEYQRCNKEFPSDGNGQR
ncbi:hypothetical protein X961_4209 [Burkholderia pseudomallei MSHR5613]|nr:hypothetical protein X961_4209 [Burkholderia pseudomallei MSHR5613]